MAKAKKLPSGNWRVNQYIGKSAEGKRLYKSFTAPSKKEAEYLAAEYVMHQNSKSVSLDITVGEAIDRYIDSKANILSPSTIRTHRGIRRNYLQGLMPVKLSRLTREMVQLEIDREAQIHAPKTVKNAHGLLSAALGTYYPEFVLNTALPQKEKVPMHIPSTEDVQQLLSMTEDDSQLHLAILLAACMGMRRGEICPLEFGTDVSMERHTITVSKSMVLGEDGQWIIKQPKTYSGYRVLPMPDIVYDFLIETNPEEGRLFSSTPNALSDRFFRLVRRAGLKTFSFHALRHYYASVMLSLNIPNKYAMQLMGHATDNMLKNVYQHTMAEKHKEVEQIVTDYFSAEYATRNATR